jgi:hypothetical protein
MLSWHVRIRDSVDSGYPTPGELAGVLQTYDNVAHMPPPPNEEYFLMTFFGFLMEGLYFLGKIAKGLKH